MVGRKPAAKSAPERTPVLEWIAAVLGLCLTLAVLCYSLFESLMQGDGPPQLTVESQAVLRTASGFVVPVKVSNAGDTTAATVQVRGELRSDGTPAEERRATFAYVPAGGEVMGGLVFSKDPRLGELSLVVEGYEEP